MGYNVLLLLMVRAVASWVVARVCLWLCERRAITSAISRLCTWEQEVFCTPVLKSSVMVFIIQFPAKRNSMGEKMQPWRTSVFTVSSHWVIYNSDRRAIVRLLSNGYKFLWYSSIVGNDHPEYCGAIGAVKGLFEGYECANGYEWGIPFQWLLYSFRVVIWSVQDLHVLSELNLLVPQ